MATNGLLQHVDTEVGRGIDDAVETLKWCKRHRHERKAADTLRLLQVNVGYLALALDWEMEGDIPKVRAALDKLWWKPFRELVEDEDRMCNA